MRRTAKWVGLMCLCGLTASTVAFADVRPNRLFTDHAVLQAGMAVPVWGMAAPGEAVTVSIADQKQAATADQNGHWLVRLEKLAGTGPQDLTIQGTNTVVVHDVLVGEVWLASGQSNMQFPLGKSPTVGAYNGVTDMEKEVAAADHPTIRMFVVKPTTSGKPLDEVEGEWQVCSPQTVSTFSAIGYLFARDLNKSLNQPIGVIDSSFGASTAEAWVNESALSAQPTLAPMIDNYHKSITTFAARPTSMPATVAATTPTTRGARGRNRGGPRDPEKDQHSPTVLWNGMLHPLQPYAIRGAIWYQGESVVNGAAGIRLYADTMKTLIDSWRSEWGEGDFPFYVCQLAGQDAASNNPDIRAAQAKALELINTGMAVTIDIGEKKNVHPKNKQDVGDRLSRIALAKVYGNAIEYSGPTVKTTKIDGHSIRISFDHADGLTARGGALKTFVIAADGDGKFLPADATIDGDSVVVSSKDVANPKEVRYAWMNWPEGCNLYNGAGLPAAPFTAMLTPSP